jgi:hypothetical protein
MYLIANVAVGGSRLGNATGENATTKIDYSCVSSDSSIPAVALQTVSSPDACDEASQAREATSDCFGTGRLVSARGIS